MDALDRVKYVLAQLPPQDQAELLKFLDGLVVTDDEREALLEGTGGGAVATVTRGRPRKRSGSGTGGRGTDTPSSTGKGGAASGSRSRGSGGSVTYRNEHVKCGKKSCTKCPHGPYTYKYWREDGRLRKRYVGKARQPAPRAPREQAAAQGSSGRTPRTDA